MSDPQINSARFSARLHFLLLAFLLPFASGAAEVTWTTGLTWAATLEKAQRENKFIFVDCFATWCGPCKAMDRQVYPLPSVSEALARDFICVQMQMDRTGKDAADVKLLYSDRAAFAEKYSIDAYPTLLIFSPRGLMVGREIGYKNETELLRLFERGRAPGAEKYYQLMVDYSAGHRVGPELGSLAVFVKKIIRDRNLADKMAAEYKRNYLDSMSEAEICTPEVLRFISTYNNLVDPGSVAFKLCYERSSQLEKISPGPWKQIAVWTVTDRVLTPALVKNGRPVQAEVDWDLVRCELADKYPNLDTARILLSFQINYYRSIDLNWVRWANYKDRFVKLYPPGNADDAFFDLNTTGTWDVFLNCFDESVLEKSLEWIDLGIKLAGQKGVAAFLDTKADVLFKIGRSAEAIALEREAVALNPADAWNQLALARMQSGIRLWPAAEQVKTEEIVSQAINPLLSALRPGEEPKWDEIESCVRLKFGTNYSRRALAFAKISFYQSVNPDRFVAAVIEYAKKYADPLNLDDLNRYAASILAHSSVRSELEFALTLSNQAVEGAVIKDAYEATSKKIREKLASLE